MAGSQEKNDPTRGRMSQGHVAVCLRWPARPVRLRRWPFFISQFPLAPFFLKAASDFHFARAIVRIRDFIRHKGYPVQSLLFSKKEKKTEPAREREQGAEYKKNTKKITALAGNYQGVNISNCLTWDSNAAPGKDRQGLYQLRHLSPMSLSARLQPINLLLSKREDGTKDRAHIAKRQAGSLLLPR